MLTKIKKLFVLVMFVAFLFVLAGCGGSKPSDNQGDNGNENENQGNENEGNENENQGNENKDIFADFVIPEETEEGFVLPEVDVEGAETTWTSSDEAVIAIDGTYADVIRPNLKDAKVTLTVTVKIGEDTQEKAYEITVKALEAPTEVKIVTSKLKYDENRKAYLLACGTNFQLEVEVPEETMSSEVKWQVSSSKRAEVTAEGLLTTKANGTVKITATSTSDSSIKDEITVVVVEDIDPNKVLLNNRKAIEEQITASFKFITEDIQFPAAPNEDVITTYTDSFGNELWNGEYVYIYDETSVDRQEQLNCTLQYPTGEKDAEGNDVYAETTFSFVVRIVADAENNEFLALEYANAKLDEIFSKYIGGATKFDSNLELPELFAAEEAFFDVEVEFDFYDALSGFVAKSITQEKLGEEGAEKLTAIYNKPNDNTTVRVEAYCKAPNNDSVVRYNIVVAGYTKEEIVEYLTANVLPQPDEAGEYKLVCQHITLPTADSTKKFDKLNITWASSDETLLTSAGKFANPALESQTPVTMTANINYLGTNDVSFAFEESIAMEFNLYPAANKAQAVVLEVSNYIDAPEFYDTIKYFPFGQTDRVDADGNITNVLPLPKTVGELTADLEAYKDLAITWTATEEGLIDENGKLLKQYLRYHEATLVYAIEYEGNVATAEVVINVGITEIKNTIYLGGNWYQQSGTGEVSGDVLCQLSKFDSPVGTLGSAAKTWGYSYSQGQFQGTTWYVDIYEVDENGEPTENFTRYQYFAHAAGFHTLDEAYKIELTDPNDTGTVTITLNEELNKYIGTNYGGNWAAIYHNTTDHEIKLPLSPLSAQAFLGNAEVQWGNHPWKKSNVIDRDNAFGIDGWRIGFVTDGDGKVVIASGEASQFQANYDADGDGQLTDADYWITVPAGGYAYTPRTQQNAGDATAKYMKYFCQVGAEIKFSYFDPYFLSPDGSSEGLGSWKHE